MRIIKKTCALKGLLLNRTIKGQDQTWKQRKTYDNFWLFYNILVSVKWSEYIINILKIQPSHLNRDRTWNKFWNKVIIDEFVFKSRQSEILNYQSPQFKKFLNIESPGNFISIHYILTVFTTSSNSVLTLVQLNRVKIYAYD